MENKLKNLRKSLIAIIISVLFLITFMFCILYNQYKIINRININKAEIKSIKNTIEEIEKNGIRLN